MIKRLICLSNISVWLFPLCQQISGSCLLATSGRDIPVEAPYLWQLHPVVKYWISTHMSLASIIICFYIVIFIILSKLKDLTSANTGYLQSTAQSNAIYCLAICRGWTCEKLRKVWAKANASRYFTIFSIFYPRYCSANTIICILSKVWTENGFEQLELY